MAEAFPMNGGDGDYSYTQNSQFQKAASDTVKVMIEEAVIEKLDLNSSISTTVAIADLGCSVGPNTFSAVQNLIQAVENKWTLQGVDRKNAEFHVFFNDHSENDFNTLFASLPANRQYYAAGAPGSFHGRLFPRASINIAHSSYALQWLSKQPQPQGTHNQGRIHYRGASAEVVRAYLDQFKRDMEVFMSARAEEMVRGGLMLLVIPGQLDGVCPSDLHFSAVLDTLGTALMELANEGDVDKAKIDEFNLPIYTPTAAQMQEVIEKNGCFSMERMEVRDPRSEMGAIDVVSLIMHLRAGLEGVFTAHFGTSVVDKMFANVSAKAGEISRSLGAAKPTSTQLFVVLKRK